MGPDLSAYGVNNYTPSTGTPVGTVPSGGGASLTAPGGNLAGWITQAEKATGVNPSQWTNYLNLIIQHESGGNPNAINNWDSNAAAGHPSQGLMQTIPGTFAQYVPAGMRGDSITDPVANVAAGIEYILSQYGGIQNVPGVVAVNQGRPYVGY
jgi:SLT domain-containing protein